MNAGLYKTLTGERAKAFYELWPLFAPSEVMENGAVKIKIYAYSDKERENADSKLRWIAKVK